MINLGTKSIKNKVTKNNGLVIGQSANAHTLVIIHRVIIKNLQMILN